MGEANQGSRMKGASVTRSDEGGGEAAGEGPCTDKRKPGGARCLPWRLSPRDGDIALHPREHLHHDRCLPAQFPHDPLLHNFVLSSDRVLSSEVGGAAEGPPVGDEASADDRQEGGEKAREPSPEGLLWALAEEGGDGMAEEEAVVQRVHVLPRGGGGQRGRNLR